MELVRLVELRSFKIDLLHSLEVLLNSLHNRALHVTDHIQFMHFLPPANEVWGKVMFLHLCVILFTGGGCIQEGVCVQGVCIGGGWGLGRPSPDTTGYGERAECILVSSVRSKYIEYASFYLQ